MARNYSRAHAKGQRRKVPAQHHDDGQ